MNLSGKWSYRGKSCEIFQNGDSLVLVNERGHAGSATLDAIGRVNVATGLGSISADDAVKEPHLTELVGKPTWDADIKASLSPDGKTLTFDNGSIWER